MSELLTGFVLWILCHTQTVAGLLLAFLLGSIWGMWIQFKNDDKEKNSQSAGTR